MSQKYEATRSSGNSSTKFDNDLQQILMDLSAAYPHLAYAERIDGGVRFKVRLTKAQVRDFIGDEQWFEKKLWRTLFPGQKLTNDEQKHEDGRHIQ